MQSHPLGRTGLEVTSLTLGTVALSSWGGHTEASAAEVIRHALDAGFGSIDTAPAYGDESAERAVGRALRGGRRDAVVVATKFGGPRPGGRDRAPTRPEGIEATLDGSLRRLGTDHVDLYQMHDPHPEWDLDEVLSVLDALVDRGKVRAIGTTRLRPEDLVGAQWAAARMSVPAFGSEQAPYSMLVRDAERGVFDVCRTHGLGVLTHAPLNGGWLTGQYRPGAAAPANSRARTWPARRDRYDFERAAVQAKLDAVEHLRALADDAGLTLPTMAIAFATSHPAVDTVIAGPRTREHVAAAVAAAEHRLDDDLLARIDQVVPPGASIDPLDVPTYTAKALAGRGSRPRPGATRAPR